MDPNETRNERKTDEQEPRITTEVVPGADSLGIISSGDVTRDEHVPPATEVEMITGMRARNPDHQPILRPRSRHGEAGTR